MSFKKPLVSLSPFPSPDSSGKPGAKKVKVSCSKKATNGSSF
ncbi:MAG: hypothetical protein V4572_05960 [Bacteroidota bacterium]